MELKAPVSVCFSFCKKNGRIARIMHRRLIPETHDDEVNLVSLRQRKMDGNASLQVVCPLKEGGENKCLS